jgi:hypothetical protein
MSNVNPFQQFNNCLSGTTPYFNYNVGVGTSMPNMLLGFSLSSAPALWSNSDLNYSLQQPKLFNTLGVNNASNFNFNTPAIWNGTGMSNSYTPPASTTSNSSSQRSTSQSTSSGRACNYKYARLSRSAALTEAAKNPNLEKLSGGNGWSVSNNSFANDIPYARKGTSAILSKAAAQIGQNITITSALGTKTSPHVKSTGYASHYNETNPKLDIGGGLSHHKALALQKKLLATGYFSRVSVESDGATSHLDVQIKESAYTNLA